MFLLYFIHWNVIGQWKKNTHSIRLMVLYSVNVKLFWFESIPTCGIYLFIFSTSCASARWCLKNEIFGAHKNRNENLLRGVRASSLRSRPVISWLGHTGTNGTINDEFALVLAAVSHQYGTWNLPEMTGSRKSNASVLLEPREAPSTFATILCYAGGAASDVSIPD